MPLQEQEQPDHHHHHTPELQEKPAVDGVLTAAGWAVVRHGYGLICVAAASAEMLTDPTGGGAFVPMPGATLAAMIPTAPP